MNNNHEAWLSELLMGLNYEILARLGEEDGRINALQNVIARERTISCTAKLEVADLRNKLDVIRRENEDLYDKLYVKKYVGDLMQRIVLAAEHETALNDIALANKVAMADLKYEFEVKLADEMASRERL